MLFFYIRKVISIIRLTYLKLYVSNIEKLSFKIFNTDIKEINFLPIDRFVLEPYLDDLKRLNFLDFIVFNFRWFPEVYTHRLMVCLPEIFGKVDYRDLVKIINRLNEPMPIISFLNFIQLYMGIDSMKVFDQSTTNKLVKEKVMKHFDQSGVLRPVNMESTHIKREKVGIDLSDFHRALSSRLIE